MGSYAEWDEEKRIEFLTRELEGKRPLVPPAMPMTNDVREVPTTTTTSGIFSAVHCLMFLSSTFFVGGDTNNQHYMCA